jgi:hypothetical protein
VETSSVLGVLSSGGQRQAGAKILSGLHQGDVHLVGTGRDSHKDEARTFIELIEWSVVDRNRPTLLQQQTWLADTRLWQILR